MITVRRLTSADSDRFKDVLIECLKLHHDSFGSDWQEEGSRPPEYFRKVLDRNHFWGGFRDDALVGMVGFSVMPNAKERHRGVLYAVYVRKEERGSGLARTLMDSVLDYARTVVERVELKVAAHNETARALYDRCGFEVYGIEKGSLKLGDRYVDQELRVLSLK